ncbi:hypothetical protein CDAR_439541 [Caerostris darwini]|uniref:Uncharacterized protein n=1 Tax=Caerostris darwini TaxID=1538125 RepID=A0AAV4MIE8_9ARAC|nr:hypothetical protein CDAR_439541 [Caerostris darwini]
MVTPQCFHPTSMYRLFMKRYPEFQLFNNSNFCSQSNPSFIKQGVNSVEERRRLRYVNQERRTTLNIHSDLWKPLMGVKDQSISLNKLPRQSSSSKL